MEPTTLTNPEVGNRRVNAAALWNVLHGRIEDIAAGFDQFLPDPESLYWDLMGLAELARVILAADSPHVASNL